jgi:3-carboxy-cis,cis-muconate cycloisomerase
VTPEHGVPGASAPRSGGLFDGVLARGRVAAAVSDRAWLQAMLDVEAGLARAQARAGVIAAGDARAIAAACEADRFDAAAIGAAASVGHRARAKTISGQCQRYQL